MSEFYNKYSAKNFASANIFHNSAAAAAAEKSNTVAGPVEQHAEEKSPEQRPSTNENNENESKNAINAQARKPQDNDDDVCTDHLFKHPLQNTWTLWYLEIDRSKSWEDMQNEITSFDTVEDFWSIYNHIKPPSEIKPGSDYSLFKQGIRPMWEDAANKQGGRWVININRGPKSDLDNLWLDVLLCLIGEAFDHSEEICGAVVNVRPKIHKISIWTANGNNEEAALEIGHKLRESLHLVRTNLQYQMHKDTMVKQGSNVRSIYNL